MRSRLLLLGFCLSLAACNGAGSAISGPPPETHRGEADAIDPARNVSIVQSCESKKGDATVITNITATNNCDKSVVAAADGSAK